MTALDQSSETIRRLIDACRETHDEFRYAAETTGDRTLKTLFALYAQQRNRFAEELRGASSLALSMAPNDLEVSAKSSASFPDDGELLKKCLAKEQSALVLYRGALKNRSLPTRTHFIVSAQLALLEKVHSRMQTLNPSPQQTAAMSSQRNAL